MYSNTLNAPHAPSLHSSSLGVGRQPLPWSPSLLPSQPARFWAQGGPAAVPIISAIISATTNTKSLRLISATSFFTPLLRSRYQATNLSRGEGELSLFTENPRVC